VGRLVVSHAAPAQQAVERGWGGEGLQTPPHPPPWAPTSPLMGGGCRRHRPPACTWGSCRCVGEAGVGREEQGGGISFLLRMHHTAGSYLLSMRLVIVIWS
jgi:hypothetical protein